MFTSLILIVLTGFFVLTLLGAAMLAGGVISGVLRTLPGRKG